MYLAYRNIQILATGNSSFPGGSDGKVSAYFFKNDLKQQKCIIL